jgi:hypothetical protein
VGKVESKVTSLSWLPMEAVHGLTRLAFGMRLTHYDEPPPDRLDDLDALISTGAARFANELRAWIQVEDGEATAWGYCGGAHMGRTRLGPDSLGITLPSIPFPLIRAKPEVGDGKVRFVQTAGGRAAIPAPRHVRRKPFVQVTGPLVWTTLALTINIDGTSEFEVLGASSFPRHWVYDHQGTLRAKTGLIDFETWYRETLEESTPWGESDSPAIVTAAESALERELSQVIIGSDPSFTKLDEDETLVEQGQPGDDLFLLFDGVLVVEIDGEPVTEVGPGAILGEMAVLGSGTRSATLRAVTPCRVAVVESDQVDRQVLAQLAEGRQSQSAGD